MCGLSDCVGAAQQEAGAQSSASSFATVAISRVAVVQTTQHPSTQKDYTFGHLTPNRAAEASFQTSSVDFLSKHFCSSFV